MTCGNPQKNLNSRLRPKYMSKIKFIESSHEYLSDEGELISVSKFTDKFKEKVNWTEVAKGMASRSSKNGKQVTANYILSQWAKSRSIGTLFHSIEEEKELACKEHIFYGKSCNLHACTHSGDGEKHSISINEIKNNTVYPELIIYDIEHMIS